MVGWQDLRSLGEAEFWVSHPRCGCFGDSAGLRLWLPGGLGDLPVLEAVSGPEPGLPQGLSSPIVLTSLCDWCGPPPHPLICGGRFARVGKLSLSWGA